MATKRSNGRNGGYGGGRKGSSYRGSARKGGSRRKSQQSGVSGFYKIMGVLAVIGIAAALYLGGYFSDIVDSVTGETGSELSSMLDGSSLLESLTTTTASTAATTTSDTVTTTRLTTTASAGTETTATSATTTAAQPPADTDAGKNAEYVLSPDYKSPYYIVVFTGSQSVVVYGKDEDGYYTVETKCLTCSSGADGTSTRTGLYSILRSYRWRLLMGGVYGQYCSGFSSSYLFHSVLYDDTDESTLFENSYRNLGHPASHGCIRLCVRDAKWIYDNCPHGTQVRVVNASGPKGESDLPPLKEGSRYRGWDPTDPHEDNPYNN